MSVCARGGGAVGGVGCVRRWGGGAGGCVRVWCRCCVVVCDGCASCWCETGCASGCVRWAGADLESASRQGGVEGACEGTERLQSRLGAEVQGRRVRQGIRQKESLRCWCFFKMFWVARRVVESLTGRFRCHRGLGVVARELELVEIGVEVLDDGFTLRWCRISGALLSWFAACRAIVAGQAAQVVGSGWHGAEGVVVGPRPGS